MNSMKQIWKVLVPVLVLGTAAAVMAQDDPGTVGRPGCVGPFRAGERMAQCLGLTEEQQTAINEIRTRNQEANIPLRKEIQVLQNQLEGEMLKENPSEKTVLELAAEIDGVRSQVRANRLKTRLAIREQLTPEQRDKQLAMGLKRGGKRGSRQGKMCGPDSRRGPGSGSRLGAGQGRGSGLSQRGGCGSGR